jgi:hypothetical protein
MEERPIDAGDRRRGHQLVMESGRGRFPVVAMGSDSCLVEVPEGTAPRGVVDTFDGDKHVAHCLIVLAAPEGPFLRCIFKRRTAPRLDPPRDFAG